jgi:hypothetical protein
MGRRKTGEAVSGWLCLDKPYDLTSTQAVGRIRRAFNAQKAGHAGTLDPLATGILPIALGEATKTVSFMMDAGKTYRFTIAWGRTTTTLDREGETSAASDVRPSLAETEAVAKELGEHQVVAILWGKSAGALAPSFSAQLRIESVHPSPLSAYRGFFGSKPFSRCNDILTAQKRSPIRW